MLARIGQTLMIGYTPEHNARKFEFDVAKWQEMWPAATPHVVIQRPNEKTSYPAISTVEGSVVTLTVTRYDTEIPGTGRMWIAFVDGDDLLGLTPATTIYISNGPSMIDEDTPPEQTPPWIQKAIEILAQMDTEARYAAQAAQNAADDAQEAKQAMKVAEDSAQHAASSAEAAHTSAQTVKTEGAAQVEAVKDAGAEQSAALAAQGDTQQRKVVAAGDAQEERLNRAVQGTVEAVVAEGERQNAAIAEAAETKKQEVVDAIEQKGQETLETIPEGYTALEREVAEARRGRQTLDERLMGIEGRIDAHRYGILWDKENAACTRLYDAEGMTANAYKGIYDENLVNDFDHLYPWSKRKVCNVDLNEYRRIKSEGGNITNAIVAWDGDVDFALDGSNGFVGVYTPEFWVRQEETRDGVIVVVADQELPGYVHFPFTIGGRYFGSSDGNGGMTSKAGAVPLSASMEGTNYTLATLHTLAKNGEMTLDDVYTWVADTILLAVEFATMNSQAAIGDGVSNLYRQNATDLPLAAGSGNSVVVPAACANMAIPGALIDFGTSTGHAQTARRVVTAVNAYAADSNYKEIVFDGDPVTYTAATIVQIHGLTNTADAQVGSKSGYIGTNGKSHAYYRGRVAHANMFRYVLGAYRQTGTGHIWYAKDREQAAAYDALDTAAHVDSGHSLPYKEDGTNAEGYVKALGLVKKLPLFPFCTEVGGSSSNPVGDYCWHPAKTSGNTVAICGGNASIGAYCGRGHAAWSNSSGHSYWNFAALPFLI